MSVQTTPTRHPSRTPPPGPEPVAAGSVGGAPGRAVIVVSRVRGLLRYQVSRRRAHQLLAVWAVLWFLLMARHGGVSWHFFVEGGDALLDPRQPGGGLHVYATHPQLQMGPLAFDAAAILLAAGPVHGLLVAQLAMASVGLLVFTQACRAGDEVRPGWAGADAGRRLLLAGAAFVPVWMNLAVRFVHIDDVLALMFVTLAAQALLHRQGVLTGVLVGLSMDAKPWALPFVVLLLALPAGNRRSPLLAAAATGWLPFLLADPRTLVAAHFTITNSVESTLRTLGVGAPVTPWWDRPAQAVLGLALAAVAVRRGRWAGVVLLATGARVVLDPGTYTYYAAGIVVGALLWDQIGTRRALPVWTWTAAVSVFASEWLPVQPQVHGLVRLMFFLLCVGFLVVHPGSSWCLSRIGPRHAAPRRHRDDVAGRTARLG